MKLTYERLVNLGNYNNERLSLEDDVRPGETPEAAYDRLRAQVHAMLGITDPKAPKAEPSGPQVGDRATCAMCGRPIVFAGDFWRHEGEHQPRHPATPSREF